MKPKFSVIALLLIMTVAYVCVAATLPNLTTPAATTVGANMATLTLKSDSGGTGYFTMLPGSGASCGTGTKVAFGPYSTGSYHGSLPLTANVPGNYTVRNLTQNSSYTVCFTAADTDSNLNQNPAFANMSTNSAKTFTSPGWSPVGGAGFSVGSAHFISLAYASDGTPYVAYVDANNSYKTTVMSYSGSSWGLVGASDFAAGTANPASLAFAPDGTPHVSFVDANNGYRATVMSYNGTTWSPVGSGLFSDTDSTSLAFAPDGTPYVSYIDASDSKATVMKYSAGGWSVLGSSGLSSSGAWSTSLAIAPDGTPYVAYSDYGNSGKAAVMKYSGSGWINVGSAESFAGTATTPSLAIAPDGTPYVAYQDGGNNNKATVMKYDGSNWINLGSASAGIAINTSLAIAPDGTLYAAYQDGSNGYKSTVMKSSGGAWSVVGSAGFSAGTANSTSLAFAPDGTPYVAYGDNGNGSRATVMKLNNFPTISDTPSATATTEGEYTFIPSATYADSFSISGVLPPGLTFNPTNGSLSGTPTTVGTYSNIVITAINDYGSAALTAFSITVYGVSQSGSVKIGSNSYSTITAALAAANNGDTLEILATIIPEGVNYGGSGVITLKGGYDEGWNRQPSLFSPVSSISIASGTLIVDRIVVQ